MIVWLASYPKSGNTYLRSFLSTYFFSKDDSYSFDLLKNIGQYPKTSVFSRLGINIKDRHEVAKSHLKVQKKINDSKTLKFLKTHSSFVKMDGYSFTDLDNTLGVIYVVRDPRDVIISFSNHNDQPINKTLKMINDNFILDADDENRVPVYMGSWSFHYNSWKPFKRVNKYILVKYEDLIKNKEKTFKEILYFLKNLANVNFKIEDKKIKKIIQEIEFEKLKKLEEKIGFPESKKTKQGKKIAFFRKGSSQQWRNNLDLKTRKSIETSCEKEMKELGYL
tara:strand:- start:72 stop:908 length:837 start_codon:yes stop_codon:yes gene_type:complete